MKRKIHVGSEEISQEFQVGGSEEDAKQTERDTAFYMPRELWIEIVTMAQFTNKNILNLRMVNKLWSIFVLDCITFLQINNYKNGTILDKMNNIRILYCNNLTKFNSLPPSILYSVKRIKILNNGYFSDLKEHFELKDISLFVQLENISTRYGTTIISPEIAQITTLKHLNLHGKKVFPISVSLRALVNLEYLGLIDNNAKIIKDNFSDFKNLTALKLNGTKEADIDEGLYELKKLKTLHLKKKEYDKVPPVLYNLKSLTCLNLDNNNIECITCEIKGLFSLKTLDLMGNNITKISREISCLTNLTSLNLSYNELSETNNDGENYVFPSSLTKLDLSYNELVNLSFIKEKSNSLLRELNLYFNDIDNVSSIKYLPNLTNINLECNQLMEFPCEMVELSRIKRANFYKNFIKNLPCEYEKWFEENGRYDNNRVSLFLKEYEMIHGAI